MKRSLNWVAKARVASPNAARDLAVTSAMDSGVGGVGVGQGLADGGDGRLRLFFFIVRFEVDFSGD